MTDANAGRDERRKDAIASVAGNALALERLAYSFSEQLASLVRERDALKAEVERLRVDHRKLAVQLACLHGAIEEMAVGRACEQVQFYVMPPIPSDGDPMEIPQPMILNPDRVHGIMQAINRHAETMKDFGLECLDAHMERETLRSRLASAERVVEAAMTMLPYFTSGNDVPVREVRLHIDLPFVAEFAAALRSHDAERGEGGEGTDG